MPLLAVLLLLLALFLFYVLFILPTQWLKVERTHSSVGIGKRVLQLSDLHVEHLRVTPKRLKRLIVQESPDLVIVTGDFLDNMRYFPRLLPYLEILSQASLPVFAVLGNHDYKVTDMKRFLDSMKRFGIEVLRNESVLLDGFTLVGIDDYHTGHSRPRLAFRDVDEKLPIVIATHDPNIVLSLMEPYQFLMAGHLHGKQFNLPWFFKLRPMGPLPARGIYKGLHRSNKLRQGSYYISKGLGQVGIPFRFLVRSEVSVHDL